MYKTLALCLVLGSCSEPQIVEDTPGVPLAQGNILILNTLGENFTLIQNLHSEEMTVQPHLKMALDGSNDAQPCHSPNHMVQRGSLLYVTCSLNHEIHVFDTQKMQLVRMIKLPESPNPMQTLFINDDLAYTSGFSNHKVLAFNPHLDRGADVPLIKGTLLLKNLSLETDGGETAPRPSGLAQIGDTGFEALGNLDKNYVPGGPGYVVAFDLQTQAVKALIRTQGRNTVGVYEGQSEQTKNWLYIVNMGDYIIGSGYVGNGSIDIYDTKESVLIKHLPISGAPGSLQFASDEKVYVSNSKEATVFVFHPTRFEILETLDLRPYRCGSNSSFPAFISSILVNEDWLLATEFQSNCLVVVNRHTAKTVRQIQTGSGPQSILIFSSKK